MRCLKIIRHHWICSFVVSLGFLSLFAFGISPESYATSVTCSFDDGSQVFSSLQGVSYLPCDFSSLDFTQSSFYFFVSSYTVSGSSSSGPIIYSYSLYDFDSPFCKTRDSVSCVLSPFTYNVTSSSSFSISLPSITFSLNINSSTYDASSVLRYVGFCNGFGFSSSSCSRIGINLSFYGFSITISDVPFDSGSSDDCPVCPDVPDIPENSYDNKFDEVTKAIYVCGAVLIMLYFFFCIYKIIVKDGGSR